MPQHVPTRVRQIIFLLAANVALMMTGYGIVMPVFGKRLGEFGSGVQELGLLTMGFALGQMLLAPVMGSLADRIGRKPLILVGLAGVIASNVGYLVVDQTTAYIVVRFLQGAVTAGILPAAMGMVGDLVPREQRAQWLGIVMGSYGAGFIFGPGIGGVLYDSFGYTAPFTVSAGLSVLALLLSFVFLPETRRGPTEGAKEGHRRGLLGSLPRPGHLIAMLLVLDVLAVFVFAFVEPQMVFHMYDTLGYSTTQFGLIVSMYGLAMVLGQGLLGRTSDRFGRNPVIALGFALNLGFYLGLATVTNFALLLVVAVVAGLGNALIAPALSAFYLDLTAEEDQARVMGFKESAAALGGVLGPLAVALASRVMGPQAVFLSSALLSVVAAGVALSARKPATAPTATPSIGASRA